MLFKADPDEVNNVGMIEFGHDEGLHQKVQLGLVGAHLGQRFDGHGHFQRVVRTLFVEPLVDFTKSTLANAPVKCRVRNLTRIPLI